MNDLVCCSRCHGNGYLAKFLHVQDGICFSCGGSGRIQKSAQVTDADDEWYRVEAMNGCKRITVLKYRSKNLESATQRAQELITRDRYKVKHKGVDWASWRVL